MPIVPTIVYRSKTLVTSDHEINCVDAAEMRGLRSKCGTINYDTLRYDRIQHITGIKISLGEREERPT